MHTYNFEKLGVWQIGMKLTKKIYQVTKYFPPNEKFALSDQLRRASTSIPLNIAEGSGRETKKDFKRFVRQAIGSVLEVITCLKIAEQNNYLSSDLYNELDEIVKELYYKLIGLAKYLSL